MLFKIDYLKRSDPSTRHEKWVNHAADETGAIKRFMDDFFDRNPNDAVKIALVTTVGLIGDMSGIDVIDAAVAGREKEGSDAD